MALPVYISLVTSRRRLWYNDISLAYDENGQGVLMLKLADDDLLVLVKEVFLGGCLRTLTTGLLGVFPCMNLLLTEH